VSPRPTDVPECPRPARSCDPAGRLHDRLSAWIAAYCLVDQLPLATFNGKDFAEYDGLRLFDVS